jgi:hypothetical protein
MRGSKPTSIRNIKDYLHNSGLPDLSRQSGEESLNLARDGCSPSNDPMAPSSGSEPSLPCSKLDGGLHLFVRPVEPDVFEVYRCLLIEG